MKDEVGMAGSNVPLGMITSTIYPRAYACFSRLSCTLYLFVLLTCMWRILQFCIPQKSNVWMYTIAINSGCDYPYKSCTIDSTIPTSSFNFIQMFAYFNYYSLKFPLNSFHKFCLLYYQNRCCIFRSYNWPTRMVPSSLKIGNFIQYS